MLTQQQVETLMFGINSSVRSSDLTEYLRWKIKEEIFGWMRVFWLCVRAALLSEELIYPLIPILLQHLFDSGLWMNFLSLQSESASVSLLSLFRLPVWEFLCLPFLSLCIFFSFFLSPLSPVACCDISVCVRAECQGQMGRWRGERVHILFHRRIHTHQQTPAQHQWWEIFDSIQYGSRISS